MPLKIYWPFKPYKVTKPWGNATDAYSKQFNDPNFKLHNGMTPTLANST
jgi:hypothetical protein